MCLEDQMGFEPISDFRPLIKSQAPKTVQPLILKAHLVMVGALGIEPSP